MIRDFKYIIKRIIIGVGIALILMLIKKNTYAQTISNFNFDTWQYVYQDHTGTTYDNTYTYRTGTGNLLAINVYYPTFEGYYLGNVKLTVNSNFYNPPVNNLYPMTFGFYVKENGAYNSNVRTSVSCSGNTCTYDFVGYQKQTSNQVLELQLLIDSNYGYFYPPSFRLSSTIDYDDSSSSISSSDFNNGVNNIIINNDNNTQTIINNNNDNTQNIINNQNENTQQQIESQQVCSLIDKNNVVQNGYALNYTDGTSYSSSVSGITDYISINESSKMTILERYNSSSGLCFYNINKSLISCISNNSLNDNDSITIPFNSSFVRFTINLNSNKPTVKICKGGNQAINDTLNDDSISTTEANDFFDNFNVDSHGVSGVITAPIRLLNALTTAQCNPLEFDLPFVHNHVVLPCMRSIYEQHFGIFFSLWQLITTGYICYNVCINLYSKIHNLQNPNNDRIEVLNL